MLPAISETARPLQPSITEEIALDTSMGLTPLEGIIMGTRCGSIDPAIIPLLMEKRAAPLSQGDRLAIMNKKSPVSSGIPDDDDNHDIEKTARRRGNKRDISLSSPMLCHQLTKAHRRICRCNGRSRRGRIASGVEENNPHYRTRVADKLAFLGCKIDERRTNSAERSSTYRLPTQSSKILVIPTNERAHDQQRIHTRLVTAIDK